MPTSKKEQLRKRRHIKIRARVEGTAKKPRLMIFRSLRATYGQLIDDKSGKVLASASDLKLKKGSALVRAEEVGNVLAAAALKAKVTECVFDRRGYKYHGRVKALADAARKGGLKF